MIEIRDLCKTYGKGNAAIRVLKNISLTISQGEFVAIMGPSGSGKSTLLHIMGFLDRPDEGSYKIMGTEVSQLSEPHLASLRNKLVGFVFQQFHLLRRSSAQENVELPLIYSRKKSRVRDAAQKLASVGLEHRSKHLPSELSGGEQQRVAIARALVNDPLIIFADEPTGNLDTKSEEEIIQILENLNEQGKTIIMVTHEETLAQRAGRIITMRDGEIISDQINGTGETLRQTDVSIQEGPEWSGSHFVSVNLTEHVRQSFRAMFTNKIRAFLSMLGILIGVAAVIAMLALGQGAQMAIEQRIRSLGSNLLSIHSGSGKVRGVAQASGSVMRFTPSDVDAIRDLEPLVKKASGYVTGNGQVVYMSENWSTRIEGVEYGYGEMRASIPDIVIWFTTD